MLVGVGNSATSKGGGVAPLRRESTMLIDSVRVTDVRSIRDSGRLELGPVTLIIGANNSGKSALLRALAMGHGSSWDGANVRKGARTATVEMELSRSFPRSIFSTTQTDLDSVGDLALTFEGEDTFVRTQVRWPTDGSPKGAATDVNISHTRPRHLMVPILTRRRASTLETNVDIGAAMTVGLDDRSLSSRLSALAGDHPEGRRYRDAMKKVLGLNVTSFPVANGASPGIPLSSSEGITLDHMGDGVRNVTVLVSELVDTDQPRLFLIEEPENDLHPAALVALLDQIRRKAKHHQFVITTHSDVVLRELGSERGSKLYCTSIENPDARKGLPTTTFELLDDELSRREALSTLGYVHELPPAWLVLEESSAERFIRQCLIPTFTPRLASVQTVAARGAGDVKRTVSAFNRLVLFTHLSSRQVPRAWVLVDGDRAGKEAIKGLRKEFKSWPVDRFEALDEPDIENYYPERFTKQVAAITAATGDKERALKAALIEDVVAWAATDTPAVRSELLKTAGPVIEHLRRIESGVRALQVGRGSGTTASFAP